MSLTNRFRLRRQGTRCLRRQVSRRSDGPRIRGLWASRRYKPIRSSKLIRRKSILRGGACFLARSRQSTRSTRHLASTIHSPLNRPGTWRGWRSTQITRRRTLLDTWTKSQCQRGSRILRELWNRKAKFKRKNKSWRNFLVSLTWRGSRIYWTIKISWQPSKSRRNKQKSTSKMKESDWDNKSESRPIWWKMKMKNSKSSGKKKRGITESTWLSKAEIRHWELICSDVKQQDNNKR